MLSSLIHIILVNAIDIIELFGIIIIAVGSLKAFWLYLVSLFRKENTSFRHELASAMAIGLEFKMAAEILKTVLIRDLNELVILGAVILLRALLAFMIRIEMKSDGQTETPEQKPSAES